MKGTGLTFKLTLGPKCPCPSLVRSKKDRTQEVLVDFSNGVGAHACFVTSIHGSMGKRKIWCLFDEHGDDLQGISANIHSTRKSSLAAVARWVEGLTGAQERRP